MAACVLHAPAALVQAELGADGGQRRARGPGRRPVDEARVAFAQRRADAPAADRLQVGRAIRAYRSSVASLKICKNLQCSAHHTTVILKRRFFTKKDSIRILLHDYK